MPTQTFLRAFDVEVSTIVIFELSLDQKIRLVAVLVVPKTDLEVFTARTGHRNARKGEFRHARRQFGLYARADGRRPKRRLRGKLDRRTLARFSVLIILGSCKLLIPLDFT